MAWYCTSCGNLGSRKTATKGSFIIELFLYLVCGFLFIFTAWPAIIIPVVYSLWRLSSRNKVCPTCGNQTMIPDNSPVARKMIAERQEPDCTSPKEVNNEMARLALAAEKLQPDTVEYRETASEIERLKVQKFLANVK